MRSIRLGDARREAERVREELSLRQMTRNIPVRYSRSINQVLLLVKILDGQTVYNVGGTTYYGINVGSVISGVAVEYDPDVSTTPGTFTAVDGIGRGIIYRNGVADAVPVLVALDSSYPIPNALVNGDYVMVQGTVSIPVSGDDPITAYIPVFM